MGLGCFHSRLWQLLLALMLLSVLLSVLPCVRCHSVTFVIHLIDVFVLLCFYLSFSSCSRCSPVFRLSSSHRFAETRIVWWKSFLIHAAVQASRLSLRLLSELCSVCLYSRHRFVRIVLQQDWLLCLFRISISVLI